MPAGPEQTTARRGSESPAAGRDVRRHNLALVLNQIVAAEPLSRAAIAARTGLTRGTVSSLVEELIDIGLLRELAAERGTTGRPASPLQLNRSGPAGLGVEIGVDHVSACVVDLSGAVRATAHRTSDHRTAAPMVGINRAATLAAEVSASTGLTVVGGTVALPGLVGADGVLLRAPNLPRWSGFPAGDALSERLDGLPVQAGNEADLAALAERWFGAGPTDFVLVSGGVGVGAGIVLDDRLFRGPGGRAGELGHVVVESGGPVCRCGGRGCLEQVAGQDALLRAAGVPDVASLLADPDPIWSGRAAAGLGIALAAAVNLLDVPAVVLGGLYARLGPPFRDAVAAELATRVLRPEVTVTLATYGTGGALRAAAASVARERLRQP